MVFNSLVFLLFYAIVLAGYFSIGRWRLQKAFLVAASFVFYGSYRPIYVPILLTPILFDFWVALRMDALRSAGTRKALLVLSPTRTRRSRSTPRSSASSSGTMSRLRRWETSAG